MQHKQQQEQQPHPIVLVPCSKSLNRSTCATLSFAANANAWDPHNLPDFSYLLATSSMETTWTQGGEKDYTESILRLLCHMQLLNHQQLQPLKPRLFKETGVGSGMIFVDTFSGISNAR